MLSTLSPTDVFTPGRIPINPGNVYAERGESEADFRTALQRGFVPVVFGEYGVGKTSMARYVLINEESAGRLVNIESAADKTLEDIFQRCLEKLGYVVRKKRVRGSTVSSAEERSSQAGGGARGFKVMSALKMTQTSGRTQQLEEEFAVTSPTDSRVIEVCEAAGVVLLIDELHRATPELTDQLARFLKAYGNANCARFRIVLLGTSSDATRLVRFDPGIDRLVQEINLKALRPKEACFVVEKGMHDLGIAVASAVVDRLEKTSVGSPNILQYLCLETAEKAHSRKPREATLDDVVYALARYVDKKEARLYRTYKEAIETVGESRYRKQILRAMSECEDEYVTMEDIRERVSTYLGREVPSTALSGPLRDLKEPKFGPVLSDIDRPDGAGRLLNYTTFVDPALKAFIRMQVVREDDLPGNAG